MEKDDADQHHFYMLLGVAFFLVVAIGITAAMRRGDPDPLPGQKIGNVQRTVE